MDKLSRVDAIRTSRWWNALLIFSTLLFGLSGLDAFDRWLLGIFHRSSGFPILPGLAFLMSWLAALSLTVLFVKTSPYRKRRLGALLFGTLIVTMAALDTFISVVVNAPQTEFPEDLPTTSRSHISEYVATHRDLRLLHDAPSITIVGKERGWTKRWRGLTTIVSGESEMAEVGQALGIPEELSRRCGAAYIGECALIDTLMARWPGYVFHIALWHSGRHIDDFFEDNRMGDDGIYEPMRLSLVESYDRWSSYRNAIVHLFRSPFFSSAPPSVGEVSGAGAPGRDATAQGLFVKIPPGEFTMGCSPGRECDPSQIPAHRVRITKGIEMGKYEVTQLQWESVMDTNPSYWEGADRPVTNVTWNDVQEFLERLNAKPDGYRYRLPTEAEWEYAARAGRAGTYAELLDSLAWHAENSGGETHSVGEKPPNAWGLYDMLGNVAEWVHDWYGDTYYARSPASDPTGPASGEQRVYRGGHANSFPRWIDVSNRGAWIPDGADAVKGFRIVRESLP